MHIYRILFAQAFVIGLAVLASLCLGRGEPKTPLDDHDLTHELRAAQERRRRFVLRTQRQCCLACWLCNALAAVSIGSALGISGTMPSLWLALAGLALIVCGDRAAERLNRI